MRDEITKLKNKHSNEDDSDEDEDEEEEEEEEKNDNNNTTTNDEEEEEDEVLEDDYEVEIYNNKSIAYKLWYAVCAEIINLAVSDNKSLELPITIITNKYETNSDQHIEKVTTFSTEIDTTNTSTTSAETTTTVSNTLYKVFQEQLYNVFVNADNWSSECREAHMIQAGVVINSIGTCLYIHVYIFIYSFIFNIYLFIYSVAIKLCSYYYFIYSFIFSQLLNTLTHFSFFLYIQIHIF